MNRKVRREKKRRFNVLVDRVFAHPHQSWLQQAGVSGSERAWHASLPNPVYVVKLDMKWLLSGAVDQNVWGPETLSKHERCPDKRLNCFKTKILEAPPPQKKKTDLFCCVPAGLAPRARSPDVKWICGVAERGRRWGRWHPVTKSPSTDVRDTGSHQTLGGAQVSTPLYLGRDAWWEDSSPLVFHSMCCWHGRQTTKTTKEVRTNVENYKLKKCSSRGFGEPSHAFYWKLIYIYIFHGTWRCLLWSRDTSVLHCYC